MYAQNEDVHCSVVICNCNTINVALGQVQCQFLRTANMINIRKNYFCYFKINLHTI